MRGCSIRAIWILNRTSKLVFSRRFPTVERQWQQACRKLEEDAVPNTPGMKYLPIPMDSQLIQAFLDRKQREGTVAGCGIRTPHSEEGSDSWLDELITRHVISLQLEGNEGSGMLWPVVLHMSGTYQILVLPLVEPRHLLTYEDLCHRIDCGGAATGEDTEAASSLSTILLDLPCITGSLALAQVLGEVVTGEVAEPEMYINTASTMGGLLDTLAGGMGLSSIGAGISGIGARAKPVTVPVAAAATAVAAAAATATSAIVHHGGKGLGKSDKDALRSFISSAMPFGTPLDLNPMSLLTVRSTGFTSQDVPHPELRQPAWKPYLYRGKPKMLFTVHEVVTAALYDRDNVADVITLGGQILCRADLEGLPDITLPIHCPSSGQPHAVTFHPCAQVPEQGPDRLTVTFSPPLGNFVLARYTALPSVVKPPLKGFYQLSMVSKNEGAFLIRMKLMEGWKPPLSLDNCSLTIPFPRRRILAVDGVPSYGQLVTTEHAIEWKIVVTGRGHSSKHNEVTFSGTVKFAPESTSGRVSQYATADPYEESDGEGDAQNTNFEGAEAGDGGADPADWEEPFCWGAYNYAKASLKILGGTMSGISIDPKSVSIYPQIAKPPCDFSAQVISGEYIFWNSLGRYPYTAV
ncbi:AP-5 complex subunit mu-1 [Marchantia polymorpha subsp. ruderalis]|uniref:MHD domain-containing protein n=1 Tax=Marchantia polymorpha TaxID=3197 RepID=A0A2R6WVF8_MARPO|nr:hypothetical protein MARPO_0055s0097 [Marchantia polymorpha]BBN02949.1 hypothetical protein Mp_2g19540 [Marchantia polymorpha subsp. ruderalis]|eukprot:PTQ37841.1 hypothetical protein MARPO_0055s0097 [Marchantia polymorpha]